MASDTSQGSIRTKEKGKIRPFAEEASSPLPGLFCLNIFVCEPGRQSQAKTCQSIKYTNYPPLPSPPRVFLECLSHARQRGSADIGAHSDTISFLT